MEFSLNHMVAPRLDHTAFFDLAHKLDVSDVEIRNDLPGVALADGTQAAEVGKEAKARGLNVLTINALQRFNLWDEARAKEAEVMIAQCAASGAQALVLCPVNDVAYTPSASERRAELLKALNALKPMLSAAGVRGFVEPLGFAECSLDLRRRRWRRSKRSAGATYSVSCMTPSIILSPARPRCFRT